MQARSDAERYFRSASSSETQSLDDGDKDITDNAPSQPHARLTQHTLPDSEPNGQPTAMDSDGDPEIVALSEYSPQQQPFTNGNISDQKTLASGGTQVIAHQETRGFFSQLGHYLTHDGNWKDLFATSVNWMLLDFTFYLLGVNSSNFIPTLFGQSNDGKTKDGKAKSPYSILIDQEQHIMESSSVGALVGSLLAIAILHTRTKKWLPRLFNSPRRLQTWGFAILAILFLIVGNLYYTLPETGALIAIVFFYQLCHLFYNFGRLNPSCLDFQSKTDISAAGPNTTTFIVSHTSFSVERANPELQILTYTIDPSADFSYQVSLYMLRYLRGVRQIRLCPRPDCRDRSDKQSRPWGNIDWVSRHYKLKTILPFSSTSRSNNCSHF